MENILISVTICLIISTVIFYNGRTSFVKKNSKCLNDIINYNYEQKFKNIKNVFSFYTSCSSKKQFDNFNINSYIISLINDDKHFFINLINDISGNRRLYNVYSEHFNKILYYTHFNYKQVVQGKLISAKAFRNIEIRECNKHKLMPITDCFISIIVEYTSPQGRNHYEQKYQLNYSHIESYIDKCIQIEQHKETTKYQRSLMTDKVRYKIMRRDKFKCVLCGASQGDGVKLHVDHIIPVSKGGKTVESNLRTLCERCNLGKSDLYDPTGIN